MTATTPLLSATGMPPLGPTFRFARNLLLGWAFESSVAEGVRSAVSTSSRLGTPTFVIAPVDFVALMTTVAGRPTVETVRQIVRERALRSIS